MYLYLSYLLVNDDFIFFFLCFVDVLVFIETLAKVKESLFFIILALVCYLCVMVYDFMSFRWTLILPRELHKLFDVFTKLDGLFRDIGKLIMIWNLDMWSIWKCWNGVVFLGKPFDMKGLEDMNIFSSWNWYLGKFAPIHVLSLVVFMIQFSSWSNIELIIPDLSPAVMCSCNLLEAYGYIDGGYSRWALISCHIWCGGCS